MNTDGNKKATLYVVATPIGNLGDISQHAIDTLKAVDAIACEDTRTSAKLLQHFDIRTPCLAYHDHNADSQTERLIARLKIGENIALISDAGTPLISDPGFRLLRACHAHNIPVSPIVGASAAIAALSVAGLPSDRFTFVGFLPAKNHARLQALKEIAERTETLIFYEAPHRIVACLADMMTVFGDTRLACLCRELTKTFETIKQAPLCELYDFVHGDNNQQKGEIVLVVAGSDDSDNDITAHDSLILRLLEEISVKKCAQLVADLTGMKKNAAYERALYLSQIHQNQDIDQATPPSKQI